MTQMYNEVTPNTEYIFVSKRIDSECLTWNFLLLINNIINLWCQDNSHPETETSRPENSHSFLNIPTWVLIFCFFIIVTVIIDIT